MMKNIFLTCLIIIILTCACSILFEDDISKETVNLMLPQDGSNTVDQNQVFWWEAIKEATAYRLQIVVGSFTAPMNFILDSTIHSDKYEIILSPNIYQWRVKALNYYSETEFTVGNVIVNDTTNLMSKNDITSDLVCMIIPKDGTITKDSVLQFWWEHIPEAAEYKLQIVKGTFALPQKLVVDIKIQQDRCEIKLQQDYYQWRIKACNAYSETEFAYGNLCVQDTTTIEQVTEPKL